MRIKKGFKLRKVFRSNVICATGVENVNFNKMLVVNEVAAMLFEEVNGTEFDAASMVEFLKENFEGVDEETFVKDVDTLIATWRESGILEED